MADSEAGIVSLKVKVTRCVFSSKDVFVALKAMTDQLHNFELALNQLYTEPGWRYLRYGWITDERLTRHRWWLLQS